MKFNTGDKVSISVNNIIYTGVLCYLKENNGLWTFVIRLFEEVLTLEGEKPLLRVIKIVLKIDYTSY